ncbi:MAG: hypothetical protein KGD60_05120 [Candidatus Thorarchaeota archaeon]|nr:hypothetical protein [Candidatus Thorarchaeota archaeon]
MSEERAKRWIEESQKDTIRQSAGSQHLQRAADAELSGNVIVADQEYALAAEAFLKSASEYRGAKSYKKAAINMCAAGDVFSELGEAARAVDTYQGAAEDLLSASAEHLMWGEDAETGKGTALAMTACMMYVMIGKEADGFYKARGFVAEHASKIRLPATVRLSQIPQELESAIQSVNLDSFASAENAAVTELKAALAGANSQEFSKYVDKGLDMIREILRGKLKVPKLSSQLILPNDVTFTEEFPLRVMIKNSGDGEALSLSVEWHLDEGLDLVSGERGKTVNILPPGETLDISVVLKSTRPLVGEKEFSVVVRGSYSDKLKTEYSFQAGPGTLVLRDYKVSQQLTRDADLTDGRVGLLKESIELSEMEAEPLVRIVDSMIASMKQSRSDIEEGDLDLSKARIRLVNDMVDTIDALIGDDELMKRLSEKREAEKKEFALKKLTPVIDEVIAFVASQEKKLEAEVQNALAEWDTDAQKKKTLKATLTRIKDIAGALASSGEDTTVLEDETVKALNDSLLVVGERPSSPDKVEIALVMARSIRNEITRMLESKKNELG